MVDREDTIHLKIKLDIDEEDKKLISDISEDLAKTEEKDISSVTRKGTTQAQKTNEEQKKDEERKKQKDDLKKLKDGPLGAINDFTKDQVNNLKQIATNPGQFFNGSSC